MAPASVAFNNVFADGTGATPATQTITLSNSGQLPLTVGRTGDHPRHWARSSE